ncbi:MAG: cobalamin-dependent protein [Thermodesulfobacteriota bacterium]
MESSAAIQLSLIEAIRRADRGGANALLDDWATEHGYERLIGEVLEPTLVLIGEEWRSRESFSLAQMYVAAKVAEDVLTRIASRRQVESETKPQNRPAILGNIEEDFHSLGRRMVGTFLRAEGWIIHDLGNDTPAAMFVNKALEVGARVIGVSAMMFTTALNIKLVRREIDRRGLAGRIKLAVGGAVFLVSPGLVGEVGGDGTASNALDAVRIFDRLWKEAVAGERAYEQHGTSPTHPDGPTG